MQTSQREPPAVVGNAQVPTSAPFFVEIEKSVVKKLQQICAEHQISIKELTSNLLQRMLLDHRAEVKQIVAKLKCRDF